MGTSKTIPINLEVTASLEGMGKVISELQRGITQGTTKLDLTKGLGASLSKEIASFEKDYARIQKLTAGGVLQLGDAKEFTKKSEHMLSTFEEIQRVIRNLDTLTVLDAKKLFPAAFDERVESLKSTLGGLTDSFDKLATKNINKSKLESDIAALETSVKELNELASKETEYKLSSEQAQKKLEETSQKVEELRSKLKQEIELKISTNSTAIKTAEEELEKLLKNRKKRESTKDIVDKPGNKLRYKGKTAAQWAGDTKVDGRQRAGALKALATYEAEKKAIEDLQEKLRQLKAERDNLASASEKTDSKMGKAAQESGAKNVKEVNDALEEQRKAAERAETAAKNLAKAQEAVGKAGAKQEELTQKQERLKKVMSEIEALSKKVNFDSINKAFSDLNTALIAAGKDGLNLDLTPDMLKSEEGIKKIRAALDQLDAEDLDKLKSELKELGLNADQTKDNVKGLKAGIDEVNDTAKTMNAAQRDMERLKDSMMQFFSLSNTIQLFKRTVRDAVNTVKELDAAMTETAVVTDFSIGDMWDKLPEYSDEANKLGASIKDLYNATTLYYQQGLKGAEVMDVGVETMKMARIAGMDATEATTAMTAALRGFNMEINEMSATRINDVYSELAAITAADTNQIATAMKKTASIAASANMEFETTAALLAQIIETTQEAPETAGTAMKTIIARFTEIKQLFSEGMLTGEDEEGEEININKIDAALKSVGISLKDFLNGTKGIDDIFLELASKWDSLDLATQRYIATTAAGSRQQSRFLAMMSNYDRTMELVNAATNSAGASQKQFDKTTESLTAKLQRLKNAWDTFAMGLADSDVIKGAVDLLTNLLTTINNLTDVGEGKIGGLITTILRLGTVLLGLKAGQGALNGFLKILDKSGAAKIFGLNMADIGKIDFTGALGGTFKTLGKTITKYNNWDAVGNMATSALTKIKSGISIILSPLKQFGSLISAQTGLWAKLKVIASPVLKLLLTGIKALFSPLGILLISLTAITAAIVGIRKAYQEAQNSFKLEKVNEEITALKEAANEAKNELEEITEQKNGLETLQSTFQNLTKGTDEWKQALIRVNQEVLSLVEKYPELQATIGKDGQLEIDSKSWDTLLNKQAQVISNINAQNIDAESRKAEILRDINFEDFAIKVIEIREETEDANYEAQLSNARFEDAENNWLLKILGPEIYRGISEIGDTLANTQATKTNQYIRMFGGEELEYVDSSEETEARINGEDNYHENQVYERAVELSKKQLDELAMYFAKNNLTDASSREDLIAGLQEIGIKNEAERTEFANLFERIMQDAEHPFYEYVAALQENTIAERKLATQFASNAISTTSVADKDYADSLANIIANEISRSEEHNDTINEQVDNKVEEIRDQYSDKKGKLDEEAIAAAYAEIMGYQSVGNEVYTDGTYSQKVDTSPEAMLRAIATEKVTVEIQEKTTATAAQLETKEEQQKKLFDDLFGGQDGSNITGVERQKYFKNGEVDFDLLAKDFDIIAEAGEDAFAKLAEEWGYLPEDLKAMLESNFEKSEVRAKKQRTQTANSVAKYSAGTGFTTSGIYKDIEDIEKKYQEQASDLEIRAIIDQSIASLERSGDFKIIKSGIFTLMEEGINGSYESFKEISELVESINWNDPVEASYQLQKELKSGTQTAKDFAQNMLSLNSTFLSDSSQLQAFFNSGTYEEVKADISEILENQDKLTAADVKGLASEYAYLNKMLKNTDMTAESLAVILNEIGENDLSFENLNNAVLNSVKSMGQLNEALGEILQKESEFDPGMDQGEAQEYINKAAEVMVKKVEGLEFGNDQLHNYAERYFGKDYLAGATTEAEKNARLTEYAEFMESLSGHNGTALQAIANIGSGKDIFGNVTTLELPEGIDIAYDSAGNLSWNFDADKYRDLDSMTSALADSGLGGSKELWDLMYTLYSNFSSVLADDWDEERFSQVGDNMKEASLQIDGKALISEKTIKDTAALWGEHLGKTSEEEIADLEKQIREQLGDFHSFDLFDEEGVRKSLAEIKQEIETLFGGKDKLISNFVFTNDAGIQTFDFSAMEQSLKNLGLTAQESLQTTYEYIQNIPKEVKQINIEGQEISLIKGDGTKKTIEEIKEEIESAKAAASEGTTEIQVNTANATQKVRNYKAELANIPRSIVTQVSVQEEPGSKTTAGGTAGSGRTGGSAQKTQTSVRMAEGTSNHPREEEALTGEEGPELVQTADGRAYLVGTEGPQIANIGRGDTVYTADETEEIYRRKGKSIPAYGDGKIGATINLKDILNVGTGSGGSSKDDDEETWENGFDKLYNLIRKIDEELRQRERIERRYEKLLESIDTSANKIIAVSREELAQLERERMLQEKLQAGRRYQIEQYQSENADLTKYANVVQNDRGEDVLRINWDLINSVTDTDEGGRIEDYVSQLEEWFDSLEEAEDALWDIEDAVEEIKERGEEEYFNMEDAIKEALTQSYQDEIDKLDQINESINETNSSLLDAIQKSIDKQRQDRDNQRTEDDLAEKQRRLLYLQQDTSGANAMEILKLQEEISQGQEDYTDTLIDQKISELQEQNDEAAKQRDQQITIAQSQLDHYIETGRIWQEVYGLMDDGLDKDTGLIRGSRLEEILKNSDNFIGMSEIAKMEWLNDTNNMIAQALAYLEIGRQLEDIGTQSGSQIEFTTSDGRVLTGTVNNDGSVTASDGQTYNNVFQGYDGKYYAGENIADVEEPEVEGATNNQSGSSSSSSVSKKNNPYGVASEQGYYTYKKGANMMWGTGVKAIQWALNDMGYDAGTIDGGYGYATHSAVRRFQSAEGIQVDGDYGPETRAKMKLRGYKTGGLADFTGPAWLDGTKARPELVLNQRDTQNFIQLKDILASLMSNGTHTSTENNGDTIYDIDINVESIGNDYDVEQVANKVKSMINDNARYRNNNTVSLAR